jgi:H2-forming N5,N10-methylenetetrahydromethanopterin dehydrogenase-like enzyme
LIRNKWAIGSEDDETDKDVAMNEVWHEHGGQMESVMPQYYDWCYKPVDDVVHDVRSYLMSDADKEKVWPIILDAILDAEHIVRAAPEQIVEERALLAQFTTISKIVETEYVEYLRKKMAKAQLKDNTRTAGLSKSAATGTAGTNSRKRPRHQ